MAKCKHLTGSAVKGLILSKVTENATVLQLLNIMYHYNISDARIRITVRGLTYHSTQYRSFRGWFLQVRWPNIKALKETSWSSRSGLNPTRTTPRWYNNTTLGNHLYAQCKGPNVTNPISWTCKNCSHKCAADCEHCVTQSSTELFW